MHSYFTSNVASSLKIVNIRPVYTLPELILNKSICKLLGCPKRQLIWALRSQVKIARKKVFESIVIMMDFY